MKDWKDNVYFVLVEPREAGNIGAAARAIKNMGFKNLCLVNPPSDLSDAALFAHNAMDILNASKIYASFEDAVRGMDLVAGTTRRRGRRRGAFIPVEKAAMQIAEAASVNKVAVLFGREDRGLYNEEVNGCGFLMTIPASKKQPSLNLAQSVVIIAYELSKADPARNQKKAKDSDGVMLEASAPRFVSQQELSRLYKRMEKALRMIEYIPAGNEHHARKIMQNMKHCLGRVGLTDWEYNMFHGICGHIEKKMGMTGRDLPHK